MMCEVAHASRRVWALVRRSNGELDLRSGARDFAGENAWNQRCQRIALTDGDDVENEARGRDRRGCRLEMDRGEHGCGCRGHQYVAIADARETHCAAVAC